MIDSYRAGRSSGRSGGSPNGKEEIRVSEDTVAFQGAVLVPDLSGALFWPARGWLLVADLHLETGAAAARRGRLLPPYDTGATLARLEAVIARRRPEAVVCLGDSFHDQAGADGLRPADRARLQALMAGRRWLWITGNHDHDSARSLGGQTLPELTEQGLIFRHEADASANGGGGRREISGHYHPVAKVSTRGRRVRSRCFAIGRERLILPAFGAYTGGLNVLDRALNRLLGASFEVRLIGRDRLHRFAHSQLAGDTPVP